MISERRKGIPTIRFANVGMMNCIYSDDILNQLRKKSDYELKVFI